MSLFVVGITAAAGLVPHARAGRVQWRTGVLFAVAGMFGAYAGGRLAARIPGEILLAGLALMMIVTAVAMLRRRPLSTPVIERSRPVVLLLAQGAAVGLLTGLVGAGGGFLIVPALVVLGGLSMQTAVGTSLLVIALNAGAGLLGHLPEAGIDWPLALAIAALAVAGSLAGARLCTRIDPLVLRRGFGWFVIAIGASILSGQLAH